MLSQVKKDHGSRAKLIEAIVGAVKRSKDKDYQTGLEKLPTTELFQILSAAQKRNKA